MHASGICYTEYICRSDTFPDHFPESQATSQWARSLPWLPMSRRGRWATAWVPPGFNSTCGRCEWCQRGRRMFCPYMKGTGIEAQGGHAEYMLMNADATYLIPDKVSYEQAAPIFCAG
jgi:alcohol dehydrogenase